MTKSQIVLKFEAYLNDDSRLKCELVNSMNLMLSFAITIDHCDRSESDHMENLTRNFLKDY